ncbi:SSI family serine proteinase inhibitor [Thermomonospora amylolytica]|uniref:SSI family serine proteinase inhibitor n=1 Tax=Thermomonospora amylolytica TaxID=1411117 RepID=UPI000E6CBF87|nr:SSI family serine proteinase inhibitor [Thermomonospora amylolytica]
MSTLTVRLLTGAALTASLLSALPAAPAAAVDTVLRLTITEPAPTGARMVVLTCDPAGGTHPRAAAACADLTRTGGRIVRGRSNAACTREYWPATGRAVGLWRGRIVRWSRTYPNLCELRAHTGAVFRF